MNANARLSLRTLGGFALEYDARPCVPAYEKGRGLLAYLAAEPGRLHARAALAAMFWPEFDREAALTNLRQVLHNLRRLLNRPGFAAAPLQIERDSVRLQVVADLDVDTRLFSTPTPSCLDKPVPAYCKACLAQMEEFAVSYRGEFMAGFALPDCHDFEEWLQVQREIFHLQALAVLASLCDCHERAGAYARALPVALRFLELEPWNEDGLRRVMRLFALNGQRAAALARYEACCLTLRKELGVSVAEATRALAEQIERRELPVLPEPRAEAPAALAPLSIAERRQVTVLYCELGCTSADDPDEALALLDRPQAQCAEIIRSHGGFLVPTHDGGLLAYFGFPQASENAARLAVQAALVLTRERLAGLELRAGIHTGIVICGNPQTPDAIGSTTGLAIRLRQVADGGELAISGATQRLVAGFFECQGLGWRQLRGIARPLEVFRVVRESGARDRLEAEVALTPLLGRAAETEYLLARWRAARRGGPRAVLVSGDAGVGKSRLVLRLKDVVRGQGGGIHELRCAPESSQSPFSPLIELFASTLAFAAGETAEQRFDKLAAHVEAHYAQAGEAVPLLARMLSLPLRAPYQASVLPLAQQRKKTLSILLERQRALAAEQPFMLVVEDLHWADPSTLELIALLLAARGPLPMFVLLTARPDFKPPWPPGSVETLSVNALDADDTTALIAAVAPQMAPATVQRIVDRADGIPLFAEELARDFAGGEQSLIPATLLDLLTARLDGMGPAKLIAYSAACVGREFRLDLLRQITRLDDDTLNRLLRQLLDAGLLLGGPDGLYFFRHALLRDAAYQAQTRAEREATHRRIASALSRGEARPERLAQHWAAAGELHTAAACWIEAGTQASKISASQEAITHFRSGLALIDRLPPGSERVRLELDLQVGLGAAASALYGYASQEGAEFYARAMTLCSPHASDPAVFPAIWRLWASASSRAGYDHAAELARQLLRMAAQNGDPAAFAQAHFALGNTLYWRGEFVEAREQLERVRSIYRVRQHADNVARFGEDVGVTSASYASWVLWFLGHADQARRESARALTLARQLRHPFSLAYALTFAAILQCRLGQAQDAQVLARETQSLAKAHGFALWEIGATLAHGWSLAMQGQPEGVAVVRQCAESTRTAMGGVTLIVLEPLLDASVALGDFAGAMAAHAQASAVGQALGDHHVDAELHRLKGESLLGLAPDDAAPAEACFQQALAISRRQQAKAFELRAALSLARLWQSQGKAADARELLQDVFHWFSEGFDTPDLRRARQLLDALQA